MRPTTIVDDTLTLDSHQPPSQDTPQRHRATLNIQTTQVDSPEQIRQRATHSRWVFGDHHASATAAPTSVSAKNTLPVGHTRPRLHPFPLCEVHNLWRMYRLICSHARIKGRALEHRCSADTCTFVSDMQRFGPIFLCRATANVHLCTRDACQCLHPTREGFVCSLTGFTHAADHVHEIDEATYTNLNADARVAMQPQSKMAYAKRRRTAGDRGSTTTTTTGNKNKARPTSRFADLGDPHIQQHRLQQFGETAERLLLAHKFTPTAAQQASIQHIAEMAWRIVVCTPSYKKSSCVYSLEYHCLVVMFAARTGFSVTVELTPSDTRTVCVVPHSQFLQGVMPARNKCNPFLSRSITDTEKLFRFFIGTCPATRLVEIVDAVSAGRIPSMSDAYSAHA
jgi:hypothetical protein